MSSLNKKGKVRITAPKSSSGEYLWKYLDLHKLIDFIFSKEIHFTRLDSFQDPIEGMKSSFLRERFIYANYHDDPSKYNLNLSADVREKLANIKKLRNYTEPKSFAKYQKSQFVSCWFHGNRESMAMWDLYSSRDSVAIKIKYDELIKVMSISAHTFLEEVGYRAHFLADSITYLKLNPFDIHQEPIKLEYAAMKKDECFKHEQEYRFLISALYEWINEKEIPFFRLKIALEDLDIKVICHPLMENWKRENIERLITKCNLKFEVVPSQIELRK